MQELRWVCEAAAEEEDDFLWELANELDRDWNRDPDSFAGRETGLYVVFDDQAVKLGISDNVFKRATALQHGTYRQLILYAAAPATRELEEWLHAYLGNYRVRGEWFAATPEVCAVAEVLLSAAQICADINRHEGPAESQDTLVTLSRDLWRMPFPAIAAGNEAA